MVYNFKLAELQNRYMEKGGTAWWGSASITEKWAFLFLTYFPHLGWHLRTALFVFGLRGHSNFSPFSSKYFLPKCWVTCRFHCTYKLPGHLKAFHEVDWTTWIKYWPSPTLGYVTIYKRLFHSLRILTHFFRYMV